MDLIKINDNKLKIMLSATDMSSLALDADHMDYTNSKTREAFRHILEEARDRTGFDAKGNQIYVQLYPSRGGGCEMFVTKLGVVCTLEESNSPASQDLSHKKPPAPLPRPKTGERTDRNRTIAFVFDEMEHLLCVCRRLRRRDFPGASEAWLGEEGKYYLLLTERQTTGHSLLFDTSLLSFLGEYGHQKNADMIRLYIREHARPICKEDAVGQLSIL